MSIPHYTFDFRTESTDSVPAALNGSVYWYDTGTTENSEKVYYDASDAYARWHDGVKWIVSAVADVGGSPINYFALVPSSITVSGDSDFEGVRELLGFANGRPFYGNLPSAPTSIYHITTIVDKWNIVNEDDTRGSDVLSSSFLPPRS